MTKKEAEQLLDLYIKGDSLKKHSRAVSASTGYYAALYNEDINLWEITGLLHDLDYEKYPDIHPDHTVHILREKRENEAMIHAIIAHKDTHLIISKLDKVLFACDELSGFIIACVWVRPDKTIETLEVKSVKKRLKDKAFARAVSRDDIEKGALLLEISLDEHIQNIIDALTAKKTVLGI